MHPMCLAPDAQTSAIVDGFDVLEPCHRQTVFALAKLAAVVASLRSGDDDATVCELASEVFDHFERTARRHHEEEEQGLFAQVADHGGEVPAIVQRLRQDHRWLERDWRELGPMVDAVANGLHWVDLDALQESAEVFTSLSLDHIALEEGYVYPTVRTRLPDRGTRDLFREMGLMPPQPMAAPIDEVTV